MRLWTLPGIRLRPAAPAPVSGLNALLGKFGVSQRVIRKEDVRFLTGSGQFIDDSPPPGSLYAQFLYSPVAHGIIQSINTAAARSLPGVKGVYTSRDLAAAGINNHIQTELLSLPCGAMAPSPQRPILAEKKVRFAGEPLAVAVAETLAQARDAADSIEIGISELAPHLSLFPGGEQIHPGIENNQAFDWHSGDAEKVGSDFADAPRTVRLELRNHRVTACSMEPRGCAAEWLDGRLIFTVGSQGVWIVKRQLAQVLGLDPDAIRVLTPDVGGGFGMKGVAYPEYFAVAAAARLAECPVRWTATRSESMLADNGGRDLESVVEGAFDLENRLVAYRVSSRCSLGAYNSTFGQLVPTEVTQKVLTGAYDIPSVFFRVRGYYTNTPPVDAYRGAGRPEAIYLIERLMDHAARRFGISQSEIRRKNFIRPNRFPYPSFGGETYDVCNFAAVLTTAETAADIKGFAARRSSSAANGRLRGLGMCCYIETILGSLEECARIEFTADGKVSLYVGTQSNGQGHETAYAQILNERAGIPFHAIECIQGDSDRIKSGGGTGGSRSVTAQGAAINAASDKLIEKIRLFAAEAFSVPPEGISFDAGVFTARGSNRHLHIMDALHAACREERSGIVVTQAKTVLSGRSFPNGVHICELEIDSETGALRIVRYSVADDFGTIVNPALVEGQIHGGVAQGIGQVILEHAEYDAAGQLLSGSLMDYAIPRAADMPAVKFCSQPTPASNNQMGMKGCGEAGTIGSLAAVANAVQDALWECGVSDVDMPCTPDRIWERLSFPNQLRRSRPGN